MNENRINVKNALAGFVKRNDSVLKKLGMLEKNTVEEAYTNASAYIVMFSRKFTAFGNKTLPVELWCDICNSERKPRYAYSLELTNVNPKIVAEHLPDLIHAENPQKWLGETWNERDQFDVKPEHYRQLMFETSSVRIDGFVAYDQSVIIDEIQVKKALKDLKGNEHELYLSYYFDESDFEVASKEFFDDILPCLQKNGLEETEKLTEVMSRRRQDVYRRMLMDYWGDKCAVTNCGEKIVLRASHAKPWSECETAKERINKYNGFLLTANLDALFDKGLITFEDDGLIKISPKINECDAGALGITPDMRLRKLEESHLSFLQYHREHVWKK